MGICYSNGLSLIESDTEDMCVWHSYSTVPIAIFLRSWSCYLTQVHKRESFSRGRGLEYGVNESPKRTTPENTLEEVLFFCECCPPRHLLYLIVGLPTVQVSTFKCLLLGQWTCVRRFPKCTYRIMRNKEPTYTFWNSPHPIVVENKTYVFLRSSRRFYSHGW